MALFLASARVTDGVTPLEVEELGLFLLSPSGSSDDESPPGKGGGIS